jgi:hypothetical protein
VSSDDEARDGSAEHDHDHDADGNDIPPAVAAEEDAVNGAGLEVADVADPAPRHDLEPGDASLLALVDRLGSLLDRSELSELAVESVGTRLVLRKPVPVSYYTSDAADE